MDPYYDSDSDSASDVPEEPLYSRLLTVAPNTQDSSPLFNLIPAEIRTEIFSHALADFPDPSAENQYETDSCCAQPTHPSPLPVC